MGSAIPPTSATPTTFPAATCEPKKESDLEKTVDVVLEKYRPTVISFGEIHRLCELNPPLPKKPTLEYFAEKILPLLKKHGITDIVLEFLLDDPRFKRELAYYFSPAGNLNKEKTPLLIRFTQICELKGFKLLLTRAKKLGLHLHAGAPTLKEIKSPEIQKEKKERAKSWRPIASRLVRDALMRNVESLLKQGKRVAVYNGLWHNDIQPFVPESSFGDELSKAYGAKYVEFDLLIRPQLLALIHSPEGAPPYPPLHKYQMVSSPKRNVCYRPSPNHFVFIFKE